MPKIGANFQFESTQPNFERDQFPTIDAMKACVVCDEGHKAYCLENQKTYEFRSVNSNGVAIEQDETTGYWHEFITGVDPSQIPEGVEIVDNLNSTATNKALSANQGKVLKGQIDAKLSGAKMSGAENNLPVNNGIVEIPQPPVKGIQTSGGTTLNPDPNSGVVTLPVIPADPTTRINNAEKRLAALESELGGDPTPVVIPVSAVNLPHTSGSTFTYDPDDTYVMNISNVQIATVCYPYDHTIGAATTSYLIFKAIDRDLYYVYTHNLSTNLCTYFEEKVFDELSHTEAKAVFEAGKYAVKQIINASTGEPRPLGYWKHGIPNVFITPHGFPLRCTTMSELVSGTRHYYTLLKCDENQKIFRYEANSNDEWGRGSTYLKAYTKGDTTTGADYEKYDVYFDKVTASDVAFTNTDTGLSSTNVQAAITEIAGKIGYTYSTSGPIDTNPTKGQYYNLTGSAISSLDIHSVAVDNTNEILILFLTDSTDGCSLTLSTSQRIIGSTSLAKGQVYIMSIVRGVVCVVEAPAYVQPVSNS